MKKIIITKTIKTKKIILNKKQTEILNIEPQNKNKNQKESSLYNA